MRGRMIILAAMLMLSACAGNQFELPFELPKTAGVKQKPIPIGPKTWAAYQAYLQTIGTTGRGAFAIAEDGAAGTSWVCTSGNCSGAAEYPAKAIASCRAKNPAFQCLVFAIDRQPQIEFIPPQ